MIKELSMISLFEIFISDTEKGKRRMLDGNRIKPQTVNNYRHTLKLLKAYESFCCKPIMVKTNIRNNQRLIRQQKKYWDNFYRRFSRFLYLHKGCHDNYCGHVFKHIKCFFRYMKNEKFIVLPEFYDRFYVRKEDIGIITLLPERFCFWLLDEKFLASLNASQQRCREMFIFGCIAALRFSDLRNIRVRDIEKRGPDYFLNYRSLKTEHPVKVKLPAFAVDIFTKYSLRRKLATSKLFPYVSLFGFNRNLKALGKKAGWTEVTGKFRSVDGQQKELKNIKGKTYRFCDLLSSHAMRRTGITILLMAGMPEYLVRKISGHTAHSESFFRYVNFAQSYITDELTKAHAELLGLYQKTTGLSLAEKNQ